MWRRLHSIHPCLDFLCAFLACIILLFWVRRHNLKKACLLSFEPEKCWTRIECQLEVWPSNAPLKGLAVWVRGQNLRLPMRTSRKNKFSSKYWCPWRWKCWLSALSINLWTTRPGHPPASNPGWGYTPIVLDSPGRSVLVPLSPFTLSVFPLY